MLNNGPDECDKTVADKRPVNLDLGAMKWPLPAITSITHRISGVILVAGTAVLLWLLDESLTSEEAFNTLRDVLTSSLILKLIVWGVMSALIYHSVAGVKHLCMDLGYGESLEGGITAAKLLIAIAAVLIVLAGALIW